MPPRVLRRVAVPLVLLLLFVRPVVAQSTTVDLGGLVLEISTARTAQLFHIVDQLSLWDQYVHHEYERWARRALPLDAADSSLLKRHATLRKARGWGRGFEQAFLIDLPTEAAEHRAVAQSLLTPEEARTEREILDHFAPKLMPLIDQRAPRLNRLIQDLARDTARLRPLMEQLRHFAERAEATHVQVFLVANPDTVNGGGEANGGRLVVEVPGPEPRGILLHESLHFLLAPRDSLIGAVAESAGIPGQMLREGIAYALGPGLTDDPAQADQLGETAARFLARGTPATNPYVQSNMMALVLRPLLRETLARGETISVFLPEAVARWHSVVPR